MKRALITALVCVNVALLAALVLGYAAEPAYGQMMGAQYLVVTSQVAVDWDAVYILDLPNRRLVAFGFDKQNKRIIPFAGKRDLARDFGRSK